MASESNKRAREGGVKNTGDSIAGERVTKMDTQFGRQNTGESISGNTNMNADQASGGEYASDAGIPSLDISQVPNQATGAQRAGAEGETMKTEYASEAQTGTANQDYDLVSVLYHSLQGAETCAKYIRDAEQSGDNDLCEFFKQVMEQDRQTAQRAMHLLAERSTRAGTPFRSAEASTGDQTTHH